SERHPALVGVDLGRHGGRHERLKDRLLILIFLILPVVAQETVRGREGGLAGGDRAYMDVLAAAPSQPTLPADPEILP
ncbi:hypothetical protein JY465_13590, partial [Stenotrophomonas maltophilia]|nr:hypothetical protein [Stenotrophomonas maltophilia]